MAVKKIVISPDNKKAIAFIDELNSKKEAIFKKIDDMPFLKLAKKTDSK